MPCDAMNERFQLKGLTASHFPLKELTALAQMSDKACPVDDFEDARVVNVPCVAYLWLASGPRPAVACAIIRISG